MGCMLLFSEIEIDVDTDLDIRFQLNSAFLEEIAIEFSYCWVAPSRPARPVLFQLQDQKRAQSHQQRHQRFNGWENL